MNALVRQDQLPGIPEPANILDVIARAANDPQTDVAKMEKLLEMFERISSKKAETEFNEAMTACQKAMGPVAAREENSQTHSKYASYADLDKALRPIYTANGFAISYSTADSPKAEHIRVVAYVTRGGYCRTYHADLPADGKGAKGGDVMTKTHAAGAAMSYGMRYLLKMIFNVAVGEDDKDGNQPTETLSDEQIANITALITETGSDKTKFLRYLKVSKLSDIPAANYLTVVKLLEAKRRQS
jgi:hypothetical protein